MFAARLRLQRPAVREAGLGGVALRRCILRGSRDALVKRAEKTNRSSIKACRTPAGCQEPARRCLFEGLARRTPLGPC